MSPRPRNDFPTSLARGADLLEIHRGNIQGFPPKGLSCKVGAAMREDAPGGMGLSIVLRRLRAAFGSGQPNESDSRMSLGQPNESRTAE